jgi:hypothetical protein
MSRAICFVMVRKMFCLRLKKLEVLKNVVSFVPVNVMDNFMGL